MELLAEENIPAPMIKRLRSDGWTVTAIIELAAGDDDYQIAARAIETRVILLTQDRDFGELAFHRGLPIIGVVMVQLERLTLLSQIDRVSAFLASESDRLNNTFTVLEPASVRRRAL